MVPAMTYEDSVIKSRQFNVDFVVKQHLCTSCGTCAGVCGTKAIEMRVNRFGVYVPFINYNLCNHCGLCVSVCPGHGFDYVKQYKRLHGSLPGHTALGACLIAYSGYTTDEEILRLSQSGGFVSTILLYCLERELIDGAVVTCWRENSPLKPKTYIARNRQEILAAVGSKYNPIPASLIIKEILEKPGRFAFVGTPCQIQGMRKAEEALPNLTEKIFLYIGLHCLGVFTYHFHEQVLHKCGFKREDLTYFRYRDKIWRGWPCDMRLKNKHGHTCNFDSKNSRLWPRPYFTNWRCLNCFDKANEFSDISCGDCRISREHGFFEEQGFDLKNGLSEFVIRTERGHKVVSRAIEEGKLVVHRVDEDSVASSLKVAGKKLGLDTFSRVAKILRVGVPEYGVRFENPHLKRSRKWQFHKIWDIAYSLQYYVMFVLMQYATVRWVMKRIPHRVLGKLDAKCRKRVEWVRYARSTRLTITSRNDSK